MKRNKPIWKHRQPGTQFRRRYRYWIRDIDQRPCQWSLYVPQALAGAGSRAFDLTGAVPDGTSPQEPRYQGGLYRWKVDRGGKVFHVFTSQSGATGPLPDSGDVWYRFTATGHCPRKHCPHAQIMIVDGGREISLHNPSRCPMGIPFDGSWKIADRLTR